MTELKTLENIENYTGEYDEIRDEAIKWVFYVREMGNWDTFFVDDFIKHFFNITEEELKEQGK